MSRKRAASDDDTFPEFADGDVKVVITGSRQYQLHGTVLRNSSPVLRELLSKEYAAPLSKKASSAGIHTRHRLVLITNPSHHEGSAEPKFVLRPVHMDSMARPIPGSPVGVGLEIENGRRIDPIFVGYGAVFAAMYNAPMGLGDSQEDGLAELLSNSFQATFVAEQLDCVRIVSKPIEALLLATGQTLYKSVARNPLSWLSFSERIKSRAIFKESLIHGAGKFNYPDIQARIQSDELKEDVRYILIRKGRFAKKSVADATRFIASYYPSMLLREVRPGDKDNISRASYGNDIIMWIAVCVFRHFICDLMASDRTHQAYDMGYAFIKALSLGGNTYLNRETLQHSFHTRFPMTPKGMACIEHRLAEVKDDVRPWTTVLLAHNSALDLTRTPVHYFTNTQVHSEDYPWVQAELQKVRQKQEEEERAEQASGRWSNSAGELTLDGETLSGSDDEAITDVSRAGFSNDQVTTDYDDDDLTMSGGLGDLPALSRSVDSRVGPTHEESDEEFRRGRDMLRAANSMSTRDRSSTPDTQPYTEEEEHRMVAAAWAESVRDKQRSRLSPFREVE